MKAWIFGQTVDGLAIPAYDLGSGKNHVLIVGGVHGNEIEGVQLAHGLLKEFAEFFPFRLRLTLVPALNLDGVLKNTRVNANGIDLNRNLPTKDWSPKQLNAKYPPGLKANSEPENQALVSFIQNHKLCFIFSLHSWKPLLNVNGDCDSVAQVLHKLTAYPIEKDIGYPTPGCLGTYTGLEQNIPTITYEIERGLKADRILKLHLPAIKEALKILEDPS